MRIDELLFHPGRTTRQAIESKKELIDREISGIDVGRLSDSELAEIGMSLEKRTSLEVPNLDESGMSADVTAVMVDPGIDGDHIRWGGGPSEVPGVRIQFRVPFAGNRDVFGLQPSHYDMNPPRGNVEGQSLVINVFQRTKNAEAANQRVQQTLNSVKRYLAWAAIDLDSYNASLHDLIRSRMQTKRQEIEDLSRFQSELGFPKKG